MLGCFTVLPARPLAVSALQLLQIQTNYLPPLVLASCAPRHPLSICGCTPLIRPHSISLRRRLLPWHPGSGFLLWLPGLNPFRAGILSSSVPTDLVGGQVGCPVALGDRSRSRGSVRLALPGDGPLGLVT